MSDDPTPDEILSLCGPDEFDEDQSVEAQIDRAERRATRDAAIKFISQVHAAFSFILSGKTHEEVFIRATIVAAGWSHPSTQGKSDWDLAASCKTHRANFSAHMLAYQKRNNLPDRVNQKSADARKTFSDKRKEQLNHE